MLSPRGAGKKIQREIHRDFLNDFPEFKNMSDPVKDYVLSFPNTQVEQLTADTILDIDDVNYNMDFIVVYKGTLEVVLEL
jgi:hypothetical protein